MAGARRAAPGPRADRPRASTSTPCSPTRHTGSSCAAAPAASARPPRPPRSALRAAEQGRRVVVLTIDPARRLAQSLGLTELDNTPRPVDRHRHDGRRLARRDDARHEAHLRRGRRGALRRPTRPSRSSPTPSTRRVSSSFAGTQEYMAMEKLGQLRGRAPTREAHRGTSSSSTPRRPARRWTSSTPPSGSARSSTAGSSGCSPRRPRPAAGPTSRSSASGVQRWSTATLSQGPRRPDAAATCRPSSAALDTMFGGFRERADADLRAAEGARDGVPRRRRARAGRPARGVLLRRPARERADAARRPRRSTASSASRRPG